MVVHGLLLRGFFRRSSCLLLSRGWEEDLGSRRSCDGGQRRPRWEGLEQTFLGGEDDAAASTSGEQDEGRRDASATVADERVMSIDRLGLVPVRIIY